MGIESNLDIFLNLIEQEYKREQEYKIFTGDVLHDNRQVSHSSDVGRKDDLINGIQPAEKEGPVVIPYG